MSRTSTHIVVFVALLMWSAPAPALGQTASAKRILETYYALQGSPVTEQRLAEGLPAALELLEQGYEEGQVTRAMLGAMEQIAGASTQPFEAIMPSYLLATADPRATTIPSPAPPPPEPAPPPPPEADPAELERAELLTRVERARYRHDVLQQVPRIGVGFTFGIGGVGAFSDDVGATGKVQGEFVPFELRLFVNHALSLDFQWNWFQSILHGIGEGALHYQQNTYAHLHLRTGPRNEFVFAPGLRHSLMTDVEGDPLKGSVAGLLRLGGEVSNPRRSFTYGVYFRLSVGPSQQWMYFGSDPLEYLEAEGLLEMTWIWYPRPTEPSAL